jgi:hypothetical protein
VTGAAAGRAGTCDPELDALRSRLAHRDRLPDVPRSGKRMDWRFRAYDELHQRLGHGDGMAEVIEVARRDFVDAATASGDARGYLSARARAQGIVVEELDVANLPARAAVLYIVGAYQQLDGFLKDLVAEADAAFERTSRGRTDKEAPIDWALDVLPGGRARNARRIGEERHAALEYYRTVRNAFTHKVKQATVEAALRRAEEFSPVFNADLKLNAPNAPDALTLDDFLLFTRMIKYVATDLCRIARPDRAVVRAHVERDLDGLRKFRTWDWNTVGDGKAAKRLAGHYRLQHRFDFDCEPGLLDEILTARFAARGRRYAPPVAE